MSEENPHDKQKEHQHLLLKDIMKRGEESMRLQQEEREREAKFAQRVEVALFVILAVFGILVALLWR